MNKQLKDLCDEYYDSDMTGEDLVKRAYKLGQEYKEPKYSVERYDGYFVVRLTNTCSILARFTYGPIIEGLYISEAVAEKLAEQACKTLNEGNYE